MKSESFFESFPKAPRRRLVDLLEFFQKGLQRFLGLVVRGPLVGPLCQGSCRLFSRPRGPCSALRYQAPVTVCTLTDETLAADIAENATEEVAIVGTLQTENLGIERLILNTLGNSNIRHNRRRRNKKALRRSRQRAFVS